MKTQFEWQIAPHPIGALKLDQIAGQPFFVGDGIAWYSAYYVEGAWCHGPSDRIHVGEALDPQPTHFLTPVNEDPQPGAAEARAGWNCGNRALAARYLMLLVERNPSMTAVQLEWFSDMIDQAGPRWCAERLDRFTNDEMPF